MYRKESLVTGGERQILIVCENGMGIKNFKIFYETERCVDVGFTFEKVETDTLITYIPKTYKQLKVTQTYYLLDLDEKRIYRLGRIGDFAKISKFSKTRKLHLGIYTDTECHVEESGSYKLFRAEITDEKGLKPLFTDKDWVDIMDMPGKMVVATFAPGKSSVQEVTHAIFFD